MIIVRMFGGLGNQMFQHAAGIAFAHHHKCELLWDLSTFERVGSQRSFELEQVFGLATKNADESALHFVLGWRGHHTVRVAIENERLRWARPKTYIQEPHFQYWASFFLLPENVYLDGYWQSEKYFEKISDVIRDAFTFSLPMSDRNQALAEKIDTCNSVSVHVRRGDYITNPTASQFHSCCTLEYYKMATQVMLDRVGNAHFFIFSDDPEWVKANLVLPAPCTYIQHNQGTASYRDMQLMSLCHNHIIANSSFSWWGAWLSVVPGKLVIAPKQWFRKSIIDTSDLYCSEWIQL